MTPSLPRREAAQPRGCLATLAVLGVMVGILATGLVVENAVADQPPIPIEVSDGVMVTPPADWELVVRAEEERTILLSKGSGSLAVTVADGTDVTGALNNLRTEWVATGRVTASEVREIAGVRPGATAYGFSYSGTFPDQGAPVEGEVTGYSGSAVTVIFDGWADIGGYRNVSDDIAQIIAGAVIP